MKKMLENLSENMTKEEIEQAEKDMESIRNMIKGLSEWQDDWEKIGIDKNQIDISARADIGIMGADIWLERRSDGLDGFKKQLEYVEEMIKKSKANLKEKKA